MSLRQLSEATARFRDTRPDSTTNRHVVYATCAHEVRRWLAVAAPSGLLDLIEAVRAGQPFAAAYARIESEGAAQP